jgi:hypothetical protein
MTELKDYAFIFPYPLYQQLMNACGLTCILMIFGKENNPTLNDLLEKFQTQLTPLIDEIAKDLPSEFCHQYILQYLLLKIYASESEKYQFLSNFIGAYFPEHFHNHMAIVKYSLSQIHQKHLFHQQYEVVKAYDLFFLEDYTVSVPLLQDQINQNTLDMDLKSLMLLFGYEFVHQDYHQDADGTGAIFYNKDQEQDFLAYLKAYCFSPKHHLICGKANHWMLVKGLYPKKGKDKTFSLKYLKNFDRLKDFTIIFNNPLNSTEDEYDLSDIGEDFRFYIFKNTGKVPVEIFEKIFTQISKDLEFEGKNMEASEIDYHLRNKTQQIDRNQPTSESKSFDPFH